VRWSAAKGIGRTSERLPIEFAEQILDNVFELFSKYSIELEGELDIPAMAENTWHGACLACAEFARRGLVTAEHLPALISWISKVSIAPPAK
jgi:tubulin-specific chaperone D